MGTAGDLNLNLINIGQRSSGGFLFGGSFVCWILEMIG